MEDVTKDTKVDPSQTTTDDTKGNPKPQSGMSVEDLAKKLDDMEKRMADKDAHITELANEKATLEQRLSDVSIKKGGEELPQPVEGNFVRADQIPVILKQQMYVERIREDNKDLIELGLEPAIELRARQLLLSGKDFETAISTAVKESREKIDKIKAPVKQPVPNGAVGEDGSVKPPVEPKKEPDPQIEDEGSARFERRMRMGL